MATCHIMYVTWLCLTTNIRRNHHGHLLSVRLTVAGQSGDCKEIKETLAKMVEMRERQVRYILSGKLL